MNDNDFPEDTDEDIDYEHADDIDFSILTMHWRSLTIFEDDLFLGMQGMNIGITDGLITQWEHELLREYNEIEKTPLETAMTVSALSQMWTFALYEVMRIWRDRIYSYKKWHKNGGINVVLEKLGTDDDINFTRDVKKQQLERYRDDDAFRNKSNDEWDHFEPVFRMIELLRMNLAKHAAPGNDSMYARAPGYGRINMWCGAMDFEVVDKEGNYQHMNRRNLADALRAAFKKIKA
ncbi:hypothetical protein OV207_24650 [Corallococcus sp. BB11-1]|uniref:hypothetical protein n=1 Tax=Corallococcus sp. BB11-1 TaxID=2996783 RepID=UPI002270C669|nr:hypothetical protein [Corallococcus sp. BB11-1]MCY1034664.1 hypothetical protein [Corallococcus sp. BB11-1]